MISAEYAAGFFDGEGSVYAGIRKGKNPIVLVCIANTHHGILMRLKHQWGGSVCARKAVVDERHRQQWQWVLAPRNAKAFLNDILPFLVIKAEVAALALEYLNEVSRPYKERRDHSALIYRGGRYWAAATCRPEYVDRLRRLHADIRALNARGYNARRLESGEIDPSCTHTLKRLDTDYQLVFDSL
jgi:hypothetical protein